jgi:hypothetical protein
MYFIELGVRDPSFIHIPTKARIMLENPTLFLIYNPTFVIRNEE